METKVQWNVVIEKQGSTVRICEEDGNDIATMGGNNNDGENARLMAAAPELRDALLLMIGRYGYTQEAYQTDEEKTARAVLSKVLN
jgi:hypothetical protein